MDSQLLLVSPRAAERPADAGQGSGGHLTALRSYLRQIAEAPTPQPAEVIALCRRIDAEYRSLFDALLAVPSAARRLRALCASTEGSCATSDDSPLHAGEVVEALRRRARARCELAYRARIDDAIGAERVDGSKRHELLTAIDRATCVLPVHSAAEHLASHLLATADDAGARRAERCLEEVRDLKAALLRANLALVLSVAVHYRHAEVPLLELVQEGHRALSKAVDRFDYGGGFDFRTYATWSIRQAIRRALRRHHAS